MLTTIFLVWLLLSLILLVGISRKLYRIEKNVKQISAILQLLDVQKDMKELVAKLTKAVCDYYDMDLDKIESRIQAARKRSLDDNLKETF